MSCQGLWFPLNSVLKMWAQQESTDPNEWQRDWSVVHSVLVALLLLSPCVPCIKSENILSLPRQLKVEDLSLATGLVLWSWRHHRWKVFKITKQIQVPPLNSSTYAVFWQKHACRSYIAPTVVTSSEPRPLITDHEVRLLVVFKIWMRAHTRANELYF